MVHLVSGADYGWRSDDTPWPSYQPDSLPPNVIIGRSSPTGVKFAKRSGFAPPYRDAMFALDWAFGRVLAVHVVPRGASYSMHPEVVLRGRPLNAVDLEFAADGSLYLVTGGYKTRSALYRLRYVTPGDERDVGKRILTRQELARRDYASRLRELRRRLESFHHSGASDAVSVAWPYLDHPDRWICHAARVAIEHQPVALWQQRVIDETSPARSLQALLAIARVGPESSISLAHEKLRGIPLEGLSADQQLAAVRIASLLDERRDASPHWSAKVLEQFEPLYPHDDSSVNRELCRLLARHGSPLVVAKTLEVLAAATSREDIYHFLSILAEVRSGWTPATRAAYFRSLHGARFFQGDEGFPDEVRKLERLALANVPEDERKKYRTILDNDQADGERNNEGSLARRPLVRKWTVDGIEAATADLTRTPDLAHGAAVYQQAQCGQCHRLGVQGRSIGPDLTAVASRFTRREIVESIVVPSKVVSSQYQNYVVVTGDGRTLTGQVLWNGFRKSMLRIATDPMHPERTIELSKHDIISHEESAVSPMPEGLLDTFTAEEIHDLVRYIEAGGIVH
jgi:putative heme-binding domain-containing protein